MSSTSASWWGASVCVPAWAVRYLFLASGRLACRYGSSIAREEDSPCPCGSSARADVGQEANPHTLGLGSAFITSRNSRLPAERNSN